MNTLHIGLLTAAALLLAASNVTALSTEPDFAIYVGDLGTSCVGWGGSNGVCWGVYEDGLKEFCVGIWDGDRCTGVQV